MFPMGSKREATDSGLKASVIPPTEAHLKESTFGDTTGDTKKFIEIRIGDLLTPDDVAKKLRVEKKTVYNWSSQGKIPFIKINNKLLRFVEADIDRWIFDQKGNANGN